jgi:pimeloyl-ACP methyl ester carboxylesterase
MQNSVERSPRESADIEERWQSGTALRAWTTPDAVIVVPGIMGSELRDASGRVLWGLRPGALVTALLPGGEGLARLTHTPGDQVRATGLLTLPAWTLGLGSGIEPYTTLVKRLRGVVAHADAVATFPYDWRLPVAHNARLLADRAATHLAFWRQRSGNRDAQVVLVAHSMGGLVCQAMAAHGDVVDKVRATITLGTPFDGAAKAALMLAEADGRLHRMLRPVVLTLPGVHDLLPGYRCVDTGDTVEHLTPADVVALGGRDDLAGSAAADRKARAGTPLPGHHALIGVEQPTVSSLRLAHGTATGAQHTFTLHPDGELVRDEHGRPRRMPGFGDGTVPRNSALPHGPTPQVLAQQHSTLAHSDDAITYVRDILMHGHADTGPRLGPGDAGMDLPDLATPCREWTGTLHGIDPLQVRCTVTDADTNTVVDQPRAHRRDGEVRICSTPDRPGLYRVRVDGAASPLVRFVLALS